ncbi:bile acid:sodium symporter [Alkalihalobacillus oceani]|uniref:arsenic resistance protein n=1 Tax=Halalkalibacter oceani TaxID=1653776 RepID=UPI0020402E3D|nr:bile acid:sodium symporter [Halalkalibacter oceani]MCM3762476.1 bile acid:sodium symporter [Halalkalibacter oceani]
MNLIEKWYSMIILTAVIVGLSLGQFESISAHAELVIMPLLVVMLYVTFLQIPFQDITKSGKYVTFTITALLINFVWTPLFAAALAFVFLADHPAIFIGFMMLMVTPCTDWYLIFTGIAKGNVALSTAILPLNLIVQVILLPVYLLVFGGATGVIELSLFVESVTIVLVIPFVLALCTKAFLRQKRQLADQLLARVSTLPIVFLCLAIAAMFASQGRVLLANLDVLWYMILPLFCFFFVNFIISQKVGQLMKFSYKDRASLSLTTLARNSPIALAIAMTAFPDEPLIALTLVIGPLLELPVLALVAQLLLSRRKNEVENDFLR